MSDAQIEYCDPSAPLPDVAQPFTVVLNSQNWPQRHTMIQSIVQTIAPNFQIYIPKLEPSVSPAHAEREFLNQLDQTFQAHGLSHIRFRFSDCLRKHLAGL